MHNPQLYGPILTQKSHRETAHTLCNMSEGRWGRQTETASTSAKNEVQSNSLNLGW